MSNTLCFTVGPVGVWSGTATSVDKDGKTRHRKIRMEIRGPDEMIFTAMDAAARAGLQARIATAFPQTVATLAQNVAMAALMILIATRRSTADRTQCRTKRHTWAEGPGKSPSVCGVERDATARPVVSDRRMSGPSGDDASAY